MATWNIWPNPYRCSVPSTKRMLEDYDPQQLPIKHMDGISPHYDTISVCNDYKLPKNDNTETTVSANVSINVKLYQPKDIFSKERITSYHPRERYFDGLTDDRD